MTDDAPEPSSTLLGAVLAGGRSRRYGADKSGARIAGVPMVQRVLAAAAAVCSDVVVVSPRPVAGAETVARVADRHPDQGPLGGLHAALHEARLRSRPGVLLLACDLPLLTPELLLELVGVADRAPAVAFGIGDGPPEVTCAVYRTRILEVVETHLDRGRLSLQELFRAVDGAVIPPSSHPASDFLNVNTPDDRQRAQELAGQEVARPGAEEETR